MKISNYETIVFIVSYYPLNNYWWSSDSFESEEAALHFINENINEWSDFIMVKQQKAIIE